MIANNIALTNAAADGHNAKNDEALKKAVKLDYDEVSKVLLSWIANEGRKAKPSAFRVS